MSNISYGAKTEKSPNKPDAKEFPSKGATMYIGLEFF